MRSIATAHEGDLLAALDPDERDELTRLLQRIADHQGLTPGVHPGFRQGSGRRKPASPEAAPAGSDPDPAGSDPDPAGSDTARTDATPANGGD